MDSSQLDEKSKEQPDSTSNGVKDGTSTEQPAEMKGVPAFKRIFRYGSRSDVVMQCIATGAASASGVGTAMQILIFGSFITTMNDFAAGQKSPSAFRQESAQLALYFVYLGVAKFVLSYVSNALFTYAAHRVTRNIRLAFFHAALHQDISFHDVGNAGSIATQATSNGGVIQGGISEKLGLIVQGVSAFIVAFVVQWKLTLICFCIVPTAVIAIGVASAMLAGLHIKSMGVYLQAGTFIEGTIGGIKAIHAFEMRTKLSKRLDVYLDQGRLAGKKLSPLMGTMFSIQFTLVQLGFGLAFWRGIHMLASGEIETSGTIFTVLMSMIIAATNLTSLAPHLLDCTQSGAAAAKLFVLIDRTPAINSSTDSGMQSIEIDGDIELQSVKFAYPARPDTIVLHDFSLTIPKGKVTALVGPSGSGKSTVVSLLERWYSPLSGSIELDSQPLDQYNVKWLRTSMRLVQQEPVLFRGTVFDNIMQGLVGTRWENASREEQLAKIKEAAKLSFAHDFITDLPNGYDTEIGQRGGLLSGSQKQRVAIARSIISDPKILLLDEATSALDPHAEGEVQRALDIASQGRTTIVIAHKLATIRNADNIVVMQQGQIVEQGTYEDLVKNDNVYANNRRRTLRVEVFAFIWGLTLRTNPKMSNPARTHWIQPAYKFR